VIGLAIGSLVGAAVGALGFVRIRRLADRIAADRPDDAGQRTAQLMRSSAWVNFLLFTAVGALTGWLFAPVD
jgi:hypothetical protein